MYMHLKHPTNVFVFLMVSLMQKENGLARVEFSFGELHRLHDLED